MIRQLIFSDRAVGDQLVVIRILHRRMNIEAHL